MKKNLKTLILIINLSLLIVNTTIAQEPSILTPVEKGDVAWGDYNNDGYEDILLTGVTDAETYISEIYKNNGDDTFTEQNGENGSQNIQLTGVGVSSVAWGDYDNDGWLDIILTGYDMNYNPTSKIYKNDQNGNFIEQTDILLTGISEGSVAWGDYDNDTYLDILITGEDENDSPVAKIYKNDQNGNFIEQTGIELIGVCKSSVAWGDYDNDNYLDILLTGRDGELNFHSKIYKNDQSGNFTEQTSIELTSVNLGSVAWGDYNNDGWIDILLTGTKIIFTPLSWPKYAKVYKNNGDGTFTEQNGENGSQNIELTGVGHGSVAWGDYDNDGWIDILLTGMDNNNNKISKIYKNNQDGTFTEQTDIILTGVYQSSVAWNDYDNDGWIDILLTGMDSNSENIAKLYKNTQDGNFNYTVNYSPNFYLPDVLTGVFFSSVAWGDYNNDTYLDILITGNDGFNYISKIYKNNGTGLFVEQTGINLTGVEDGSVAWGDYNNDNYIDILITGKAYGANYISKIYKNNQDGTFTEQNGDNGSENIELTGVYNGSVTWGDYDNDNYLDILLTGSDGMNRVSKIYKNNQDGTFTEQDGQNGSQNIQLPGVSYGSVAWGDYNNDNYLDILLTGSYDDNTGISKIYKNNQDGTFTEQTDIELTGVLFTSVAWGDYDNDNYLDILLTGRDEEFNRISKIYKNNQNETFTEQNGQNGSQNIELVGLQNGSVVWGDYNNDNYLDILLTGLAVSKIYKNNQNGNFEEQTGITLTGVSSSSAAWSDYNNDNYLDILLTGSTYFGEKVAETYKNDQNGNFENSSYNFTKLEKSSIACGDYDKNGTFDILLSGTNKDQQVRTEIYNNNNAGFNKTEIDITGLHSGSVSWTDYNNNGYLDFLVSGKNQLDIPTTKIYKNGGNGVFMETQISISGVSNGHASWADYNNDGYSDLLLSGINENENLFSKVYKNTGNENFEETNIDLHGSYKALWGDYNNDMLMDILLYNNENRLYIYKNIGDDNFEKIAIADFDNHYIIDIEWTDKNNDGFIDIFILFRKYVNVDYGTFEYSLNLGNGQYGEFENYSSSYQVSDDLCNYLSYADFNNSGSIDYLLSKQRQNGYNFSNLYYEDNTKSVLFGTINGSMAYADFDNDSDLDLFISGKNTDDPPKGDTLISNVYINNCQTTNTTPTVPTNLQFHCNADTVFISWNKATDNETEQNGLTYNCYMYEIGGDTIWHSLSNQGTGKRYIPKKGNVEHNTSWFIQGLDVTKEYAWSVQVIDNAFAASQFASEQIFRLAPEFTLQPLDQTVCETGRLTLNTVTTPADSYQWYRFTASDTLLIQNNEYFSNTSTPNLTISNATLDMHAYEFHCKATTVGGDTYSQAAILSVDSLFIANAGNDTVACDVTEIQLSANLPNNTTGLWSCENSNITFDNPIIPNTTVRNLPQDVASTLKWTITQQNVCGENSDLIIVTQNPSYTVYPVPPTPSGEMEPCISQTANYQTAGIGYATSYLWEITPQEAGTVANDSIQTTITWSATYTGIANIRTKAQDACNYGEWSENLSVYIKSNPTQANIPTGDSGGCINGQNNFSTVQVSDANSYTWQISPPEAGEITGNTSQITAQWKNDYSGEAYIKVKGINQCGEGEFSDSLKITLDKPITSDIIEKSKTMLVSVDSGYTYQWYRDGEAITGATKQYYYNENMPTGDYQIEIIDKNDCNCKSEIYTFGISTKTLKLSETISIYPNPTTGKFTIEIINDYTGKINFAITNAVGQIIFEEKISKQTNYLKIEKDLLYLPTGIYLIEFIFENEKVTKQLIVE